MKQLLLKTGVLVTAAMVAAPAFSYAIDIDGFTFEVTSEGSKTVTLKRYNGFGDSDEELVIPEKVSDGINEYTVTSIESDAFTNPFFKSVTFPSSLKTIKDRAFNGGLIETVTLPSTIESMEGNPFNSTSIQDLHFYYPAKEGQTRPCLHGVRCINLYLHDVEAITSSLISGNSTVEKVTILSSEESTETTKISIDSKAFMGCSHLRCVDASAANLTTIGNNAFSDCSNLNEVRLPKSLTNVGMNLFDYSSNLESLTLYYDAENLSQVGSSAFMGVTKLQIGADVKVIPVQAFYNCQKLNTVTFEEGSHLGRIGTEAFKNCTGLTAIELPSSVTSIDENVFQGCENLKTVTFAEGSQLGSIGAGAFSGCTGISEITIPSSVTSIGANAFSGCTGISEITIPSSVTSIGANAFNGCAGISEVTIPSSVTKLGENLFGSEFSEGHTLTLHFKAGNCEISPKTFNGVTELIIEPDLRTIPDNAFTDCTTLKKVTFAEGSQLESIGANAFYGCAGISEIAIPSSVTSIGAGAFSVCTGISEIAIPSSVTSIGVGAFSGCAGISEMIIGPNLQTIPDAAFNGCTTLETVTFAEGSQLESIGEDAFNGCSALTEINFPSSVTSIGANAFCGCTGISEITIPSSVTKVGGNLFGSEFSEGHSLKLHLNMQNCEAPYGTFNGVTELIIGNEVQRIGGTAFFDCSTLKKVMCEEDAQLESIGKGAFQKCPNLKEVHLPSSLTSIGDDLFGSDAFPEDHTLTLYYNATDLSVGLNPAFNGVTKLIIGAEVENIPNDAFQSCVTLKEVTFAEGTQLKTIGSSAFYRTALSEITIPTSVTSIGQGAFGGCNINKVNYNAKNCMKFYDSPFVGQVQTVTIGAEVETIPQFLFAGVSITTVEIPASVKSIGKSAFEDCKSLETVTFAENSLLESIGDNAFQFCSALTAVSVPSNVTSIGQRAFQSCGSLETVTFAEDAELKSIGDNAFYGCTQLESVTIPTKLDTLGNSAFYNCGHLTTVNYNAKNIKEIDSSPFGSQVQTVTIGDEVETIPQYLFKETKIKTVKLPASVKSIGEAAFAECSDLQSVTMDDNSQLESIGEYAFNECGALATFNLPSSLQEIGGGAFQSTALTEITIPSSVTSIGERAFAYMSSEAVQLNYNTNCEAVANDVFTSTKITSVGVCEGLTSIPSFLKGNTSLKSVSIPSTITALGEDVFSDCEGLETVTFAENTQLKTIGASAFKNCNALKNITLPSSLESIGDLAFQFCTHLPSINLPSSVKSIGNGAFQGCASVTSVTIPSSVESIGNGAFCEIGYEKEEGVTLNYNATKDVTLGDDETRVFSGKITKLVLGDAVEKLPANFINGEALKSVEMTSSVKEIADEAFFWCCELETIKIPASASIGNSAFSGCSSLKTVEFIPTKNTQETTIGDNAFYGTALEEINIPSSVKSIGKKAFYCEQLQKVTFAEDAKLQKIGYCAFSGPITEITIPESVTEIMQSAFSGCASLQTIHFNAKHCACIPVPKEESAALFDSDLFPVFSGESMKTIDFGNQVEVIPNCLCNECSSLESVTIPASVQAIGKYAFRSCQQLSSVTFENASKLKTVGEHAFENCEFLPSVAIPSSVETIGDSAFCICPNLATVTFDANAQLTTIGESAFANCNLNEITLPALVNEIGDYAFENNYNLATITFCSKQVPTFNKDNSFGNHLNTLKVVLGTKEAYTEACKDADGNVPFTIAEVIATEVPVNFTTVPYATVTLPFDAQLPENVLAFQVVGVVDGYIKTEKVDMLNANTPYLLKSELGNQITFNGAGEVSDYWLLGNPYSMMQGTTSPTPLYAEKGCYVMQILDGKLGFYPVEDDDFAIPAYRAVLRAPGYPVKAIFFNDDATGVNEVTTADEAKADDVVTVYNMNGVVVRREVLRKNATQGLPAGIYLVDGQKVMVK